MLSLYKSGHGRDVSACYKASTLLTESSLHPKRSLLCKQAIQSKHTSKFEPKGVVLNRKQQVILEEEKTALSLQ